MPPGTEVEGIDGARFDLLEPGQRAVVAHGGGGGSGNKRFASSTRQAPRFAERGVEGESGWIELRLKLLADAGLVGLPNAGKSSLLARLTAARPKVADYPFTTIEPVLGTIEADDRQLVLADIPGLIEGAAAGAGLGHEFLAHVERCGLIVHVVDIAREDGAEAYATVREELGAYGAGLARLPELVALSKRDLVPDERADEAVARWRERLGDSALDVVAVSSATGAGIEELRRAILAAVPEPGLARAAAPAARGRGFEAEHRVYTPAATTVSPSSGSATASSASRAAASSCSCAVTTSRTPRRSATWSSACARSASSASFAARASSPATRCASATSPSSSILPRRWPSGRGRRSPVAHRAAAADTH